MSASLACPTCGNVNMADARFCARCGTQLDRIVGPVPTPAAASPAPAATPATAPAGAWPAAAPAGMSLPPPPGGDVTITHRGQRHGVGYAEGFYGVWSLRGGAPLQRFERTDAGWQLAWAKFQELEASGGEKRKLFGRGS
jgi:hypothetical protein